MNFPDDLRYTQEHEGLRVNGTTARVGITTTPRRPRRRRLRRPPQVGATWRPWLCCEVESTKSVSEIFSPVSGTVAEVNTT